MRGKIIAALLGAFFLGGGIVLLFEETPEQRARRDIARCTEFARIMTTRDAFERHLSQSFKLSDRLRKLFGAAGPSDEFILPSDPGALYGLTFSCFLGNAK